MENLQANIAQPVILPGDPAQLCPELLTTEEAIRYLRLDVDGPTKPKLTLRHYREKGLLQGIKVGRRLRYRRADLDRFLEELAESKRNRSPLWLPKEWPADINWSVGRNEIW